MSESRLDKQKEQITILKHIMTIFMAFIFAISGGLSSILLDKSLVYNNTILFLLYGGLIVLIVVVVVFVVASHTLYKQYKLLK